MEQSAPPGRPRVSGADWALVRGLSTAEAQLPLTAKGHEAPLRTWLVTGEAGGADPTVQPTQRLRLRDDRPVAATLATPAQPVPAEPVPRAILLPAGPHGAPSAASPRHVCPTTTNQRAPSPQAIRHGRRAVGAPPRA